MNTETALCADHLGERYGARWALRDRVLRLEDIILAHLPEGGAEASHAAWELSA